MKEYNGTSYEKPVQSQVSQQKAMFQPLNANKNQMLKSVQESLLEGLPETKVERRKEPEKPLTGKQRRAMKKSLSMIMEQEQHERQLP